MTLGVESDPPVRRLRLPGGEFRHFNPFTAKMLLENDFNKTAKFETLDCFCLTFRTVI